MIMGSVLVPYKNLAEIAESFDCILTHLKHLLSRRIINDVVESDVDSSDSLS